jgi:hypothetical protein
MKLFLTKTIYISLPILVVAIFMEILLRNTPNDYSYKKEYLDKHSAQVETLILGSSHSFYGFNPDSFCGKVFNASHISQSLNYDFKILKKYEDKFINLETIVLPISYFTLFSKLESGSESWRVKNYIIYYGLKSSRSLTDYSEILSNLSSINIRRVISYYVLGNSAISCTNLGWGTSYNSKKARNLVDTGETAAIRHTRDNINSYNNQKLFNENILILKLMIEWCRENNVKILLLTPPAFETYRKGLNIEQLNITIETTSKIASKYDNCIYLNLLSDTSFYAKDFYDADHLSEIGAEKLSELINSKINEWELSTNAQQINQADAKNRAAY